MHLAGGQREAETFQDLAAIDIDVKVLDLKHSFDFLTLWHQLLFHSIVIARLDRAIQ